MSDLLRPSSLGDWATCAKKARYIAANPQKETGGLRIATWVGSAVHAFLAAPDSVLCRPNPGTLYDTTTPSFHVATAQVNSIVTKFHELMEVHGLEVIDREVEVENVYGSGTLDMVLKSDVDKVPLIIADLKTGKRIPSGSWLQLGAYFNMAKADLSFMDKFGLLLQVAVIHIPRTPLHEVQSGSIESRQGAFCGDQSNVVYNSVRELIEQDRSLHVFPASPGGACRSCPMTEEECPVKIVTQK